MPDFAEPVPTHGGATFRYRCVLAALAALAALIVIDGRTATAAEMPRARRATPARWIAQEKAAACCVEGNLAHGKPTRASSEESGKNNFARGAVDGNLQTRWCAASAEPGQWWLVDLEQPAAVRSLRIQWESPTTAYRFKIEASSDAESWQTLVDQSSNKKANGISAHEIAATPARYLRVTFAGSNTGGWGSFWEFEAYSGKLPELPKILRTPEKTSPAPTLADVHAPDGFDVTLFGVPPEVNYPVCLAAAATGELFVGVDEQGSLGKEPGRGKVLRCIDEDGDGRADKINTFAKLDHPRGLIYDDGTLWVLHPPFLSVFFDDDRDGVADRSKVLISGISTDQVAQRGADHTTNGIRMGIDGWIYIAVGDFGFNAAKAADGTALARRGGGVVRVRPDGGEMEIFAWGTRNILDVGIDPSLNFFTRDNTNDGGGWNVRVSQIFQSAEYGYPSLYLNFADEIMPPLADYGGGSGCGVLYFQDVRWPEPFANGFYSCDWGRSEVYRHNPAPRGPTFAPHQEVFLKIPRPTDIDVDGSGRMYVSSWKNGEFNYRGPDVGFVARVTPKNFTAPPCPNLKTAADAELMQHLTAKSAVLRLASQRELLRRGPAVSRTAALESLASNAREPLYGRVAAIFTLKQLDGAAANPPLLKLAADRAVREFALRAVTDRNGQWHDLPIAPFVEALRDADPRVQAQALVSLGRLGNRAAADAILPLTRRSPELPLPTAEPLHAQADPGRVLPHLAVRALVAMNAVEACVAALDGPWRGGALWALRQMHDERAVDGLIAHLARTRDPARREELLTTLIRLYHREGDYTKSDWWGTRPDNSGPYYDRQTWSQSERIAQTLKNAAHDADPSAKANLQKQLARHKVEIAGLTVLAAASPLQEPQTPIVLPQVDADDPSLIGNLPADRAVAEALQTAGDALRGQALFARQSCTTCHTYANGQLPKGPHLVDIGKRYKRQELLESVLKPSAKIAQGFDTWVFVTESGKVFTGFVVTESAEMVEIRQTNGLAVELRQAEIEERKKQDQSMMPVGLVNNLKPAQLADLIAYLESLH